jgi:hypothetical protein
MKINFQIFIKIKKSMVFTLYYYIRSDVDVMLFHFHKVVAENKINAAKLLFFAY